MEKEEKILDENVEAVMKDYDVPEDKRNKVKELLRFDRVCSLENFLNSLDK